MQFQGFSQLPGPALNLLGKEGDVRIGRGAADLIVNDIEQRGKFLLKRRQGLPGFNARAMLLIGLYVATSVAVVVVQKVGEGLVGHQRMIHA